MGRDVAEPEKPRRLGGTESRIKTATLIPGTKMVTPEKRWLGETPSRHRLSKLHISLLKEKKTEGEALPSPLSLKDHLPKVAAAVIVFAGCMAG